MNANGEEKSSDLGLGQRVKKVWGLKRHITSNRVSALATSVIAIVTVWTLLFTPLGERFIADINRSLEETQDELERHRTVNAKVTLRAVWSKFDDGLAENEYFAKVAADYHTHVEWMNSADEEASSPSNEWFRLPYRDGFGEMVGVPFNEPSRWGERLRTMLNWWPVDWEEPKPGRLDPVTARKELRAYLDGILEEHFGGGGHGAPASVSDVIDEMKRDEDVEYLGGVTAEIVRDMLDDFLRQHPILVSKPVRVRFTGPYTADEVVEAGEEVERNITEVRDALRSFVKIESDPYF